MGRAQSALSSDHRRAYYVVLLNSYSDKMSILYKIRFENDHWVVTIYDRFDGHMTDNMWFETEIECWNYLIVYDLAEYGGYED